MIGARNVKGGLALLALSLGGGLAMSLYAFQPLVRPPAGLERYDDLPRRLLRLAHVAAVMLPLLNVVFGFLLDRVRLSRARKELASVLLLAGAAGLPLALAAEAFWPPARAWHLAAPPAVAFVAGTALLAAGALRTPSGLLMAGPLDAPSGTGLEWLPSHEKGGSCRSSSTSPRTGSPRSPSPSPPPTATPTR